RWHSPTRIASPRWGNSLPRSLTKSISRSAPLSPTPRPDCAGSASGHPIMMKFAKISVTSSKGEIGRARSLAAFVRWLARVPPRYAKLDLNEGIIEVIALTRSEMARNRVMLDTRLENRLSPLYGDRIQLQQVILNLIVNAVEAMSAGGDGPRHLRISGATSGAGAILVAVADSGPGLGPEVEQLFDPFYTTKPQGMGMGLSICRAIVEAHEGRLWAAANTPRGAVFQFTPPIHPGLES